MFLAVVAFTWVGVYLVCITLALVLGDEKSSRLVDVIVLAVGAIIELLLDDPVGAAILLVFAAYFLWSWWKRSDRECKLFKLVGYKAKALRDKLMASMPKAGPTPALA